LNREKGLPRRTRGLWGCLLRTTSKNSPTRTIGGGGKKKRQKRAELRSGEPIPESNVGISLNGKEPYHRGMVKRTQKASPEAAWLGKGGEWLSLRTTDQKGTERNKDKGSGGIVSKPSKGDGTAITATVGTIKGSQIRKKKDLDKWKTDPGRTSAIQQWAVLSWVPLEKGG